MKWEMGSIGSRQALLQFNPLFNPEVQGAFQMKIGYFIIPLEQLELYQTDRISESVLKDLQVLTESGELTGYRLFVHPEAYTHFKDLFNAGIIFIKPEHSEFIGTPTSSYRSWAVRRVVKNQDSFLPGEKSTPFIVKLGVESRSTNRLLHTAEIKKSIDIQRQFDVMNNHPKLLIFSESIGLTLNNIPNYPPAGTTSNSGISFANFLSPY